MRVVGDTAELAPVAPLAPPPPPTEPDRRRLGRVDLVLVLVVGLGAGLRWYRLGDQSLWFDEWSTAEATSGGIENLLRYVGRREGTPPAYFVLVWGWVRVAGDSEAALRTISALAGVATVPVAYAVARELRQPRGVARVAATLVAVSPMLVWISQEARPYSLLTFSGAVSTWAFVRLWRRGRQRDVVAWALACAVVMAVHYFGGFLIAAQLLVLLVGRRVRVRQLVLPAVLWGTVVALHVPFVLNQRRYSSNQEWIGNITLSGRLEEAGRTALVGPSVPDDRLWRVVAGVAFLALVLVVGRGQTDGRRAAYLLGGVGTLAVLLPLAADLAGTEMFLGRYLVAVAVPVMVAVALGLGRRGARGVGLIGVAVVAVVSVGTVVAVSRDPDLQRADWRQVADVVAPTDDDGGPRLVVMNRYGYAGWAMEYHLPELDSLGKDEAIRVERIDVLRLKGTDAPCNHLVGRACGYWFLGVPPPDPLGQQLELEETVELDQFYVDRYRADGLVRVMLDDLVVPEQRRSARAFIVTP